MSWVAFTVDTIEQYLASAQVEAIRTAALGNGQEDPLPLTISNVVAMVRAMVASCQRNQVDADITLIPEDLVAQAAALVIEAAQPRVFLDLTEDQRRAADNARRYLDRVASCAIVVAQPADAIAPDVQKATPVTVVTKSCRRWTRQSMEGL